MSKCSNLKHLPEKLGELKGLKRLDASSTAIEQLPDSIAHLNKLVYLNLSCCKKLRKLPEQFGNMEALETFHASFTAIEQLPDSIAHLKKLISLSFGWCKKLRKLPEQLGNMEGLENFDASFTAIEQLPDSFSNLLNLVHLNLHKCSQLKRLPEHLGKMQRLEKVHASYTAIEELPNSIGLLPRITELDIRKCKKLTYVPKSICNLKSLAKLYLTTREDIIKFEWIEAMNDINLENLILSCNIRVCLPMILSFSSLIYLRLYDECGSPSPTKPFSFFQLFNLTYLFLTNCTSHGSSFPELPLNLRTLEVKRHASLEQVPDLSYLKHLKFMSIMRCCSLQSLHKLPPHVFSLKVEDCTSLQDFPDLSMLRDLKHLEVLRNGSNLKVSLEENHLQLSTFKATLPNKEIAEWFDYKNREGCTLSFDVPPNLGDNFLGLALWVVHKCSPDRWSRVEAVITNETEDTTAAPITIGSNYGRKGDVHSSIHCIWADDISMKSGDKIMISYPDPEVNMCGVHILK